MDPRIRSKLEKSWAPVFYEHVFCKINEEPFAVLYGTTGNPNFPVNIILSLEYIKHMKDCNDLELMDSFYFDYLVNYAVGIRTLGEMNLAERTLYYFRERVYRYCIENPGAEDLLFGQFLHLLKNFAKEANILLEEQRTDTTLFMSNIKKAGRMSLAYDVLVRAVREIPESRRPDTLSNVLGPDFKKGMLHSCKTAEIDGRLSTLLALCKESLVILEAQCDISASEVKGIVKRFLEEQTVVDAEGKVKVKSKKEITSGSLQSAYDEGATYHRKGNAGYIGYSLEISESCNRDNPFQLITDYSVEPNNVSDVDFLNKRLPIVKANTGCVGMYVDGNFHSEKIHQTAGDHGIEIHLTNMGGGLQPEQKLPVSAFDIDEVTNIIKKCPGGYVPINGGLNKSQTSAYFPHEACASCHLNEFCYSKKLAKNCVVKITIKAVKASREREKIKVDKAENTSKRAAIEGTNSALKRKGQDKLNVRGKTKVSIVSGLKVTAQNIKRFIKFKQGGYNPKSIPPPQFGTLAPTPA
jgi:hypothetical protein